MISIIQECINYKLAKEIEIFVIISNNTAFSGTVFKISYNTLIEETSIVT